MDTLKLLQETKREKNPTMMSEDRSVTREDDLIDLFPLPRYFQVHFQHIHENANRLQEELDQLKQSVVKADEKLERLTALLGRLPNDRV